MRLCEKCKGPGPTLWSDAEQRYLCVGCHETPNDEFFQRVSSRAKLVSQLKAGDKFMWQTDVAIVHDIVDMPEHILTPTHGMMYSLDVEVPNKFRGAVQVLGSVTVVMVDTDA